MLYLENAIDVAGDIIEGSGESIMALLPHLVKGSGSLASLLASSIQLCSLLLLGFLCDKLSFAHLALQAYGAGSQTSAHLFRACG